MVNNKRMIAICGFILLLVLGGTAIAATKITQKSKENSNDGSGYSAYYDKAAEKNKSKTIQVGDKTVDVSYVRTENLKEKAVTQRKSKYGTYDVFVDNAGTEYLYLCDSELFCGFKRSEVGVANPINEAISETVAIRTCQKYIEENRDNSKDYKLTECFYDERGGYYDAQYSFYVNNVKTDDVLRIWVNAEGHITAISEFNRERYAHCNVTAQKCADARQRVIDKLKKTKADSDYVEVDCFLSQNDDAEWIYVIVVDIKVMCDKDAYVVQRQRIEQNIE